MRKASSGGEGWQSDRPGGVEVIRHDGIMVYAAFANVDVACDDELGPKPRSYKGAGAERACQGNLFGDLPQFSPSQTESWARGIMIMAMKLRAMAKFLAQWHVTQDLGPLRKNISSSILILA